MEAIQGLDRAALDRARISRDARFDGRFYIAVLTTGIYCRPICPSPTSRKSNVHYFATAAAAAESGFRPCLRCRPEAAPGTPAWSGTSAVVCRALRLIEQGALDGASVEAFSQRLGVSARHLHRLFIQHVGASPIAVAQTRRLHFAKRLIDETRLPMTEIALASGFGSVRRFNDAFKKTYRRSPRELRGRRGSDPPGQREHEVVLRLAFRPPYDWDAVAAFLGGRILPGIESMDSGAYCRTLTLEGRSAVACVRPLADEDALELRLRGASATALYGVSVAARRAFDLSAEPGHVAAAFAHDPLLAPLVRARPGLRIPGVWDPFECAVRAVLGQQVSVAAARTFASRLADRAGRSLDWEFSGLRRVFPTAAQVAGADLDDLGPPRARIAAIRTLAQAVCRSEVDFTAPVNEVTAALAALPGIGDWTAQYVALRALGDPDAFPAGDVVLRRMANAGGAALSARELLARAEAWRPWRAYAVIHLWRAARDAAMARSAKPGRPTPPARGQRRSDAPRAPID